MSAARVDLIEVRGDQDQPTHFLWHHRVYAVREVLGHWTEGGVRTVSLPAAAASGTGREVWRVQASRGRCFDTGVYDLSFDHVEGRWTLTSTTD